MSGSGMKKLLEVAAVGALLILGTMFTIYVLASTDEGVDLSGSEYEDQHNSTSDMTILSISIMNLVIPVLGVVALIIGIFAIKKNAK